MHEIRVNTSIQAPPERVFAFLADHERFLTGEGLTCTVATPGVDAPNGVGAVRLVRSGPLLFREEILSFEPDQRYEYVIRTLRGPMGLRPPVTHDRGWVQVRPDNGVTGVEWGSRFRVDLPFGTRFVGSRLRRELESSFERVLWRAKRTIEA